MNKQVKELVERVRLTDEELEQFHLYVEYELNSPYLKQDKYWRLRRVAQAQLNKVFKEDLALIDREIEMIPVWGGIPLAAEDKSQLFSGFPLAELKEVEG